MNPQFDRQSAEAVVALASRAPSIHNTQPWRWQLTGDGLSLLTEPERRLRVADPDGHSLRISCGAALHLTGVGLRAAGWQYEIERRPDGARSDVLARFTVTGRTDPDPGAVAAADAARRRRSDRRPFDAEPMTGQQREQLRSAGTLNGVNVDFPDREDQRVELAVAVTWADRVEREDPAYIEEMQRWLRDSDVHADGVVPSAVPQVRPGHPRRSDLPQRDFEIGMPGRQLIAQDVDERPLIAVLFTGSDSDAEQLAAGEAMMALMIEAELAGLATCPLSQAVDLAAFRIRLQTVMGWVGYPQIMLRVGHPVGAPPEVLSPRRPVADVLS